MKSVTIEDIIDVLGEVIDVSEVNIDENTGLGDDLPVDSGEMLRIISRVESKYSFRFSPEDLIGLGTVGDILKTTRRYLNARCQK